MYNIDSMKCKHRDTVFVLGIFRSRSTSVTQTIKALNACDKSNIDTLYVKILRRFTVPFVALSIDKDTKNMVVKLDGASTDLTLSFFACPGFSLKHMLLFLWFLLGIPDICHFFYTGKIFREFFYTQKRVNQDKTDFATK